MRIQHAGRRRLAVPAVAGVVLLAAMAVTVPADARDGSGNGDAGDNGAAVAVADQKTDQKTEPRGIPVRTGISSIRAERLADRLGPKRTAGVYVDQQTERMVVTVTDAAAERAVTEAGGVAERVSHSTTELKAVTDALDEAIDTPGTTWGTDVDDNRINVSAYDSVSGAEYAEMAAVLEPYGDAAKLGRVDGKLELAGPVNGGKFIEDEYGRSCSAGFNVRKKNNPSSKHLVTAGHCTRGRIGADWENGAGSYFGYATGSRFPGTDYGLIRHYAANIKKPGNVYHHGSGEVTDITHSRDPGFGESVCMSGYRSGVGCGTVYELDVTVHYDDLDATVEGLFRTDICINKGDSGGSVFHNDAALGLNSGFGSGCIGYHQRVNPALAWYNVEVY